MTSTLFCCLYRDILKFPIINGPTGPTGPTADVPVLISNEIAGSISVLPAGAEVTVVSVDVPVTTGDTVKIDYALTIDISALAVGIFNYEVRLYRDATLIDTRVVNTALQIGSQSMPIDSTQVDTAVDTTTSTYSLRVFVTSAVLVTTVSAVNRDINAIVFP